MRAEGVSKRNKRLRINPSRGYSINHLQFAMLISGEMSEWFKEHAWKVCIGE